MPSRESQVIGTLILVPHNRHPNLFLATTSLIFYARKNIFTRRFNSIVILESRFQFKDERVWLGKAKLLPDRIILSGMGYGERILLDEILRVEWSDDELTIVLEDDRVFELVIRSAALWKYEI